MVIMTKVMSLTISGYDDGDDGADEHPNEDCLCRLLGRCCR